MITGLFLTKPATVNEEDLLFPIQAFTRMFPWLFPRGMSGLASSSISLLRAAKWLVSNTNHQYRTDTLFISKLFEFTQANQTRLIILANDDALLDLLSEYKLGHLRLNTQVALTKCAAVIMDTLPGSCVVRKKTERLLWSITASKNPPTFWFTLDLLDCLPFDESVLAHSEENDRDRLKTIRRLRNTLSSILEDLMGISSFGTHARSTGATGVIGKVSAYLTAIEDNDKGGLRIHIALWMSNSPTFQELNRKLWMASFRQQLATYFENCFATLDSERTSNRKPPNFEILQPFPAGRFPSTSGKSTVPWNHDLIGAANVCVQGRVLIHAEDTAHLGRLMGTANATRRLPAMLAAASSLKTHPSHESPTLSQMRPIVQNMVNLFAIDRDISHSHQLYYLMGWPDATTSHPMVEIDLDEIKNQLMIAYPELR